MRELDILSLTHKCRRTAVGDKVKKVIIKTNSGSSQRIYLRYQTTSACIIQKIYISSSALISSCLLSHSHILSNTQYSKHNIHTPCEDISRKYNDPLHRHSSWVNKRLISPENKMLAFAAET